MIYIVNKTRPIIINTMNIMMNINVNKLNTILK